MRFVLFAATILVFTLFCFSSARAVCDCVEPSASENYKNADLVFEGEVVGVTAFPENAPIMYAYTFQVHRTLKGPTTNSVTLYYVNDCDAGFFPGYVYRVYARNENGALRSSACGGKEYIGDVDRRPWVTINKIEPRWRVWYVQLLVGCGVGVLLGSGVFVWRRVLMKSP